MPTLLWNPLDFHCGEDESHLGGLFPFAPYSVDKATTAVICFPVAIDF